MRAFNNPIYFVIPIDKAQKIYYTKDMNMNKKKEEKIRNILGYRVRGYSLSAIARIFKYKSREAIRLIIERYRNEPAFKDLYAEVDKTWAFLNRKF